MHQGKTRVIIVEDDQILSKCLGLWLELYMDCEIIGYAENGETGLQLCREHHPSLVLVDIMIPKLDGLSMAELLLHDLPGTRLIVLSGYSDPYTIWRVLQSEVHGYIVKRGNLSDLQKGICTVLKGGKYFSSILEEVKKTLLNRPESFQNVLTRREQEVLRHVAIGAGDRRIATDLGISPGTIEMHRKNIRKKLALHNDREMVEYAIKWGLVTFERQGCSELSGVVMV